MATSSPSTPRASRTSGANKLDTPKSIKKRTITNLDPNSSYIEENDMTYNDDETHLSSTSIDDESYLEISEILEDDLDLDDTEVEGETKQVDNEIGNIGKTSNDIESSLSTKTNSPTRSNTINNPIVVEQQPSKLRAFIVKHEVIRKGLHSYIGIFTLWLYTLGVHQKQLILPLSILFAVIFVNDTIRFQHPELNKKIVKQFWFLIRDSEINSYNGTLWYLIGLILVFAVAPKDISLMSVLLLSWADTSASTFGRKFGKYTPKVIEGKSLAGCLASAVTGILSCYLLYGYYIPVYNDKVNVPGDIAWTEQTSKLNLHLYALLSGLIASVSELITIFGIDDNFSIPVLSGAFLYGLVEYCKV